MMDKKGVTSKFRIIVLSFLIIIIIATFFFLKSSYCDSEDSGISVIDDSVKSSLISKFDAQKNVDNGEIQKLFPASRIMFYLPDKSVDIPVGSNYNLALGLANVMTSESSFSYNISLEEKNCNIVKSDAEGYLSYGKEGNLIIPGKDYGFRIVSISIPSNPEIGCLLRYTIKVLYRNEVYAQESFDVRVVETSKKNLFLC